MDLIDTILERTRLSASEKLALIVLARKQGRGTHCRVSAGYLAIAAGFSKRTAQSALKRLAQKHEINCKRHRIGMFNEVNSYSVMIVNNINRRRAIALRAVEARAS